MAEHIETIQDALRKFSQLIAAKWVFDEASVALDAGCDYKLSITVTENGKGFIVAMHRHQTERLGHNSFIKLGHGEWSGEQLPPAVIQGDGKREAAQGEDGKDGVPVSDARESSIQRDTREIAETFARAPLFGVAVLNTEQEK